MGVDLEVNLLSSLDIPRSALSANKDILMKWSVTQSLSTTEQLEVSANKDILMKRFLKEFLKISIFEGEYMEMCFHGNQHLWETRPFTLPPRSRGRVGRSGITKNAHVFFGY